MIIYRRYNQEDEREAICAAEHLANAVQNHAGACACRLCRAWELIQVFNILDLGQIDQTRSTVAVDD